MNDDNSTSDPVPSSLLVSVSQAAALLGISLSTMRKMLKDGTIASGMIGRKRMVKRAALEAYANKVTGG